MHNAEGRRGGGRLLFDRRYGWVVDEWREPSADALAGGRGMFCILPIFKQLAKLASQSVDLAASSIVKTLEERGMVNGLTPSQPFVKLMEGNHQRVTMLPSHNAEPTSEASSYTATMTSSFRHK